MKTVEISIVFFEQKHTKISANILCRAVNLLRRDMPMMAQKAYWTISKNLPDIQNAIQRSYRLDYESYGLSSSLGLDYYLQLYSQTNGEITCEESSQLLLYASRVLRMKVGYLPVWMTEVSSDAVELLKSEKVDTLLHNTLAVYTPKIWYKHFDQCYYDVCRSDQLVNTSVKAAEYLWDSYDLLLSLRALNQHWFYKMFDEVEDVISDKDVSKMTEMAMLLCRSVPLHSLIISSFVTLNHELPPYVLEAYSYLGDIARLVIRYSGKVNGDNQPFYRVLDAMCM